MAADCPSPKKPRGDRWDEKQENGGRNRETAVAADNKPEEAWMAMVLGTSVIADNIETRPNPLNHSKEIPEPITMTPEKAFATPADKQ